MLTKKVYLVTDLGYGDAGKGSIVDYLVRQKGAHTVLKYNGVAQAAHNVVTPDGRHYTFSHFGSGSFVPGTRTYISQFALVHPYRMCEEEEALRKVGVTDAFKRMFVDGQTILISPYEQAANRLKEIARGGGRHGSCGMGVGETMSDSLEHPEVVLKAVDAFDKRAVRRKLYKLRDLKWSQLEKIVRNLPDNEQARFEVGLFEDMSLVDRIADYFFSWAEVIQIVDPTFARKMFDQPGVLVAEGSQGVLLDEWFGFFPYNTWTTLTTLNAETLMNFHHYDGERIRLGLLRGYGTRHGAGPFVTEDAGLTGQMQDYHNSNNPWQREFRVGYPDLVAAKYGVAVTGALNGLVVTNLDRMRVVPDWKICKAYSYSGGRREMLPEFFNNQGNTITGIKLPTIQQYKDLEAMQVRTSMLEDCSPIYEQLGTDVVAKSIEYAHLLADELQVPLAITSCGPSSVDKINHLDI